MKTTKSRNIEPVGAPHAAVPEALGGSVAPSNAVSKPPAPRRPTVAQQIVDLIRQPEGASLAEIIAAFRIQAHSARAIISIQRRAQLVDIQQVEGRYRIIPPAAPNDQDVVIPNVLKPRG